MPTRQELKARLDALTGDSFQNLRPLVDTLVGSSLYGTILINEDGVATYTREGNYGFTFKEEGSELRTGDDLAISAGPLGLRFGDYIINPLALIVPSTIATPYNVFIPDLIPDIITKAGVLL